MSGTESLKMGKLFISGADPVENRKFNSKNPIQGPTKKVLCICSAGLLRSPTAAVVLSQPPFNFNTRAAGATVDFALVPVDEVLLGWADEIVCMQPRHMQRGYEDKTLILHIEDNYAYRDPELMRLIAERYTLELERRK